MKKILHICLSGIVTDNFLYQDNLLSKYHKRLGYDVSFITSQFSYNSSGKIEINSATEYFDNSKVKFFRLKMIGFTNFSFPFKFFYKFKKTLQRIKPDIIFIHGPQFLNMIHLVSFLKKHKNIEVYMDNHADFSNSGTNFFSRNILHKFFWRQMSKLAQPYCKKIYGVLPSRVNFLKEVYDLPPVNIQLLKMGADDDLIKLSKNNDMRSEIRNKLNIKQDDILILTGGKIDKFKIQTLTLMEAFNKLNIKNTKLIVFGSIDKSIEKRIMNLTSDRIKYIGWIEPSKTYSYFDASDLLIFPGRHSVFWEQAVGQAKPLICKKWPGMDHLNIGGNIIFLENDSKNEIIEKLKPILSDKLKLNEMTKAANNKQYEDFLYSNIAKKSLNL
jgi:glycosyltransferase involved in cell wall biosynthesis